ncbi:MAG: 50S ribosomal protein L35 [Deltaproteobacteria bacterium]|nr:50S ribosomal protein L35 [Deltaproteobacteria bacterium]MCX7953094.1 50S ribosomal protein L35 [Deltaproteobacteria bacterium]
MPKIKTNKTAYKKFKITKSGKAKRHGAFLSHNTAKKTSKRINKLQKLVLVSKADLPKVEKMLPGKL